MNWEIFEFLASSNSNYFFLLYEFSKCFVHIFNQWSDRHAFSIISDGLGCFVWCDVLNMG